MDNNYTYGEGPNQVQPATPAPKKNAIVCMALGIASIVLSETGIFGIVCAIISKSFHKKFLGENCNNEIAFSTAGKITSTVGLILSIIEMVTLVILFLVFIIMIIGSGVALTNPNIQQMLMEIFG